MIHSVVDNPERRTSGKSARPATKCVLIDDHPIVLAALKAVVKDLPEVEVVGTARNRIQALEMMPTEGHCLVVTDLSLPDSEGLDLIHELLDLCPSAQILVFSMHDELNFGPRALAAGAHGYLMKGDDLEGLRDALSCVLSGEIYASPLLAQKLMRQSIGGRPSEATVDSLTEREFQVFKLFGEGHSIKEIAYKLNLSPKTIETHREKIKVKLGHDSSGRLLIAARDWLKADSRSSEN